MVDFKVRGERCPSEASATSGIRFDERCDGVDNDCDGVADETIDLSLESCTFQDNGCNLPGYLACQAGAVVCLPDATLTEICDGSDNDCDGEIDEGVECQRCESNGDCLQDRNRPICNVATGQCRSCLMDQECLGGVCIQASGACGTCDPASYRGCRDSALPVCSPNGAQCQPCTSNVECSQLGSPDRRVCIDGRCGRCVPDDLRLGCESPERPICDLSTNDDAVCRGCMQDMECGPAGSNAVCFDNGSCRGCNSATHRGCNIDGPTPICDAASETCVSCDPGNNQCQEINAGQTPICTESGSCGACLDVTSGGCEESSNAPICADGRCRGCSIHDECDRRDGRLNFCGPPNAGLDAELVGACLTCNPISQDGCSGATPICGGNGECRECRLGDLCPNGDICVSGLCVNCNPADNRGCSNGGPGTPICDDQRQCNRCEQSGECDGVWGLDGLTECVEGRCSECSPRDAVPCPDPEMGCVSILNRAHQCDPCIANEDCGPERVCFAGRCGECDPNDVTTCPEGGSICDPALLICIVQGCQTDDECGADVCVSGECQTCDPLTHRGCDELINNRPSRCLDGSECVECLSSYDCGSSDQTPNVSKICSDENTCLPCQSDEQCAADFDDEVVLPICSGNGARRRCRFCENTEMNVNEVDNGCRAPYTRCLDVGIKCCRPAPNAEDCITEL